MDEMQWLDQCPATGDQIELETATIQLCPPIGIQSVSGDIEMFRKKIKTTLPVLGLCGPVEGDTYLVSVARDEALWITPEPQKAAAGWYKAGYSLNACDDAWVQFRISGIGAEQLVSEGASSEISIPSRSAAILFAGQKACIIKHKADYLVFVPSPMQTYLWAWFKGAD